MWPVSRLLSQGTGGCSVPGLRPVRRVEATGAACPGAPPGPLPVPHASHDFPTFLKVGGPLVSVAIDVPFKVSPGTAVC